MVPALLGLWNGACGVVGYAYVTVTGWAHVVCTTAGGAIQTVGTKVCGG